MDRIKKLKVKKSDGTISDYMPIGVDCEYVDFGDGDTLEVKMEKMEKTIESLTKRIETLESNE